MSQITWWELFTGMPPSAAPPGFVRESDTSAAAAQSIKHLTPAMRGRVLNAVREYGADGCTCDELETYLQLAHQTCSARVRELAKERFIRDSGRRRPTRSGRKATVWVATARK